MRNYILALVVAAFGFTGAKAQTGFEADAYVGIPIGDASDIASVNFGVEAAYYWVVAENIKAGALVGYDYWSGKKVDVGFGQSFKINMAFLPIAATGKYDFGGFFGGLDLGYAIYVGDGSGDGGFLYRPKVGWSGDSFDAYAFYKGISSSGSTISAIGVGFGYKF